MIGASLLAASAPVLPAVGLSKWSQIQPFIPFCRETWRKLVIAGKAPQAIRLSETCTVYRNEDVHRWLADPLNYRQDAA
ncbi:transcriptional regulator [Burkholderia gladioli]|nr:transcriptional regulator [Burkholderia gladioli]PEH87130.1 transcriptional regulator [Burkholderia gladioli]